jgi:hypothetical protein
MEIPSMKPSQGLPGESSSVHGHDARDIENRPESDLVDSMGPIPAFPPRALDSMGRLIPISPEVRAARRAASSRASEAIRHITDETDTDEVWESVYRGIDEERPHRKLFEGCY